MPMFGQKGTLCVRYVVLRSRVRDGLEGRRVEEEDYRSVGQCGQRDKTTAREDATLIFQMIDKCAIGAITGLSLLKARMMRDLIAENIPRSFSSG